MLGTAPLLLLLLPAGQMAHQQQQQHQQPVVVPWKQDRFAISFWVDPIVPPERFDAEYARIAAANFTVLLGGFGARTPADVTLQIAAAKKAGLAAVPSICGGACANLSGAWGFQIADEPDVAAFPKVAQLVEDAKSFGQMAFVNLLPNYAGPSILGATSYGSYIKKFVEVVKPNMLSVDHCEYYPSVSVFSFGASWPENVLVSPHLTQR